MTTVPIVRTIKDYDSRILPVSTKQDVFLPAVDPPHSLRPFFLAPPRVNVDELERLNLPEYIIVLTTTHLFRTARKHPMASRDSSMPMINLYRHNSTSPFSLPKCILATNAIIANPNSKQRLDMKETIYIVHQVAGRTRFLGSFIIAHPGNTFYNISFTISGGELELDNITAKLPAEFQTTGDNQEENDTR